MTILTDRSARTMLGVLCVAQFVLILDVAVVNVALVPMARDLGAAPEELQAVASVYAACFGGGLLLGGRFADSGRRRGTFVAGLVLFAFASLLCGAAWNTPSIVAGRALQGLGAALASPAALSLLTTTFREGVARDRALGIWASVAATGAAAGLLAGGLLTELVGWRSVFLVNPPIIVAVVLLAVRVLPAGRREVPGPHVPVGSGLAAAAAVVLLVGGLGVIETGGSVWLGSAALAAAAMSISVFIAVDHRVPDPLVPRALWRSRSVLAANAVTGLMSAVVLGVNFFLAVHLQDRLGLGPVGTGLAFLPITVVSAFCAVSAARLVARTGTRPLLAAGMASMVLGCGLLALLPAQGAYFTAVLPGIVLVAAGMGPGFAVGSIAATTGVPAYQQGAAAALLSASTQVGAAVGLAGLGVVSALAGSTADPAQGSRAAFAAMAFAAVLAVAAALALPAGRPAPADDDSVGPAVPASPPPLVPAQAASCLPGCTSPTSTLAHS